MAIRLHNVLFAAKQSLWLLPAAAVFLALLISSRGGTLEDFAWGMIAAFALTSAYFLYRLWRTQRRLPSPDRETSYPFRDPNL
jgi:hypothetical protein